MKWTVENIEEERYVRVTTTGIFTLSDHVRMIEDILYRRAWRSGTSTLFDHRSLDFLDAGPSIMNAASSNHLKYDKRIGGGKAAILMKSAHDFSLGRQFEVLTQDKVSAKLRIFMDEEEAVSWLVG